MAKKGHERKEPLPDSVPSLFDRENLEFLDALRYASAEIPSPLPTPLAERAATVGTPQSSGADRVFDEYRIADADDRWGMGELNVRIIHRGKIRIHRAQWKQIIATCSAGLSEDGIRKDFHLNILQHASRVRLIYVSYRYKQSNEKQAECRRGILVDDETNIRELMIHLAFWFTAQPHAEKNYPVWKGLVEEAMSKLQDCAEQPDPIGA